MNKATRHDHSIIDGVSIALNGEIGHEDDIYRLKQQIKNGHDTGHFTTACQIAISYIRWAQDLKTGRDIFKTLFITSTKHKNNPMNEQQIVRLNQLRQLQTGENQPDLLHPEERQELEKLTEQYKELEKQVKKAEAEFVRADIHDRHKQLITKLEPLTADELQELRDYPGNTDKKIELNVFELPDRHKQLMEKQEPLTSEELQELKDYTNIRNLDVKNLTEQQLLTLLDQILPLIKKHRPKGSNPRTEKPEERLQPELLPKGSNPLTESYSFIDKLPTPLTIEELKKLFTQKDDDTPNEPTCKVCNPK